MPRRRRGLMSPGCAGLHRPADHRRTRPLARQPAEGRAAHLLRQPPEPLRLGADLGRAAARAARRDAADRGTRLLDGDALKHWLTREVFNAVYVSRTPKRSDDEDPLEPLVDALRQRRFAGHLSRRHAQQQGRAAAVQVRGCTTWPSSFRRAADPGVDRQRAACDAQGRSRAGADPVLGDLRRAAAARCRRRQAAFLARARDAVIALGRARLMAALRELSVSQQVGLLFVDRCSACCCSSASCVRRVAARAHARAAAQQRAVRARAARGVGRRGAVLGRMGVGRVRRDAAVRR